MKVFEKGKSWLWQVGLLSKTMALWAVRVKGKSQDIGEKEAKVLLSDLHEGLNELFNSVD